MERQQLRLLLVALQVLALWSLIAAGGVRGHAQQPAAGEPLLVAASYVPAASRRLHAEELAPGDTETAARSNEPGAPVVLQHCLYIVPTWLENCTVTRRHQSIVAPPYLHLQQSHHQVVIA